MSDAGAELVRHYFPGLTARQCEQFEAMGPLYAQWNEKINVVSRRDIDNVYLHHILHSLALARLFTPCDGTRFMDLGTGGGFPAIPLAAMWPGCTFHLVDRVAKKLRVAADVATELGLENVTLQHGDAGECHERFDFVLSRAVMPLDALVKASRRNIAGKQRNTLANGLLCLKGGDLAAETAAVQTATVTFPLTDFFAEGWFEDKYIVYVPLG